MLAKDRIIRIKIKLQDENPFFAHALLFHEIREDEKVSTIMVCYDKNRNRYYLRYNPKWIDKLDDEQLKGVLCHEILHILLRHLHEGNRILKKAKEILKSKGIKGKLLNKWMEFLDDVLNMVHDVTINYILLENDFQLPFKGCIPEFNLDTNSWYWRTKIAGVEILITNIDKKTSEQIFMEILDILLKSSSGKGKPSKCEEVEIKDLDYDKVKEEDLEKVKEVVNRVLNEAKQIAKMVGKLPLGIERIFELSYNYKIDWKRLLRDSLKKYYPTGLTWVKPNKKYEKIILPSTKYSGKEALIIVDLSGSISNKELNQFMTEIYGILRNRAKIRLLTHDSKVQDDVQIKNLNELLKVKIHGGGGTDFNQVAKYIHEKKIKYKVAIWFTDGFGTEIDKSYKLKNLIWVISRNGTDKIAKRYGKVIWMS